jgi:PAS domain S-box-containing protein
MFPKATQFEKLLEAVPDALVGVDQTGVIRFVNRQIEHLFGYDRDQLIGEPIDTLVPEPLWQVYAAHREDFFADPKTRSLGLDLELSGQHQDGTKFPIHITMSLIDTGDVLLVITGAGDVARLKQAVAKAELLDALVKYSDDAISGLTLGGIVTSWNPAAERMYGYCAAEVIGRTDPLIPPDRAGELDAILARIKGGHHVEHAETTFVRKDGTVVPVSLTAAPIRDEDGSVAGATAVHRDVTEQRAAFEIAQRMAAIVESSQDAIFGRGLDDAITSWNPAAARMFGYSGQEIVGKSVYLMVPPDRAGELDALTVKVRAGQHIEHLETCRVRKDGTVIPVSLTISPIRDASGAVIGLSTICRDTTEQVEAARALATTSRQYRLLAENASDLVVLASPDREITWVSPSLTRTLGWDVEDLMGTRLVDLVHPDDVAATAAAREVVYSGHEPATPDRGFLMRIRTRSGQYRWMSGAATPVTDESGVFAGVVAGLRDVDDLVQAREAAEALAAIVKGSQDAIIGRTLEGIITSWNPAAERMFGYSSKEIIGKSADLLVPEDRVGEAKTVVAKVSAGQLVEHLETNRVRKDGTMFPASITLSPIRDADGVVVGVSVICRDATQQRQAFQAAQRMAAIVESSDDAIVSGSLDGIITSWNPAAERMYGYSSEEIVGKPARCLTPADLTTEIEAVLAKIEAGQRVEHLATRRVRRDGTVFPVSLTVSPVCDADGAIVGTSVIHRDMSELEHAARYARSLIEAGMDPLVTISAEGKVTDVNEAAVTVTGVPREALIGTDFSQYVTDPDTVREGFERAFEQGSLTDLPLTLLHRDGTLTDVLCNVSVYRDVNGTVLGVLAVARGASLLRQQQQLSGQLQEALNSRVVIEQAKGMVAQKQGVTIDQAYELIRTHARDNNTSLRAVAEAIVGVGLQI